MTPEALGILDYNTERRKHWSWLTMLGEPIWDTEVFRGISPNDSLLMTFSETRGFVGKSSLDALRYFWTIFSSDSLKLSAVECIFYYYSRKPKQLEFIQRESRVVFPLEVAINPNRLSLEWINRQRSNLVKKWGLGPVSFGITGNVYSPTEWNYLQSYPCDTGELGEHWFHDVRRIRPSRFPGHQRFMVFTEMDKKATDEQFLYTCEQLGTPFLVVDTRQGHHLLFPLLFDNGGTGERKTETEVYSKLGLILGIDFDHRYLFHCLERYESVIRVTPGLGREEVPLVSALVWDGKTIIR